MFLASIHHLLEKRRSPYIINTYFFLPFFLSIILFLGEKRNKDSDIEYLEITKGEGNECTVLEPSFGCFLGFLKDVQTLNER